MRATLAIFTLFIVLSHATINEFFLTRSYQSATVRLAQNGETFQHATNNEDSGTVLLFTGNGPVVYVVNTNGLPIQNYNDTRAAVLLPSRVTRVNLTDLNNDILFTEVLTGGWTVTQNGTENIYLFGALSIYVLSLNNGSYNITQTIITTGLHGALVATAYNNSLYIPCATTSQLVLVNLNNSQISYYTTRHGAYDIFLRSDGLLFLVGVDSEYYSVDIRNPTTFAAIYYLQYASPHHPAFAPLRVSSIIEKHKILIIVQQPYQVWAGYNFPLGGGAVYEFSIQDISYIVSQCDSRIDLRNGYLPTSDTPGPYVGK